MVCEKIVRKVPQFGLEFIENFRRVRPFVFPEEGKTEKIVRVRGLGIECDGFAKFADGIVLHFRVAIGAAKQNM